MTRMMSHDGTTHKRKDDRNKPPDDENNVGSNANQMSLQIEEQQQQEEETPEEYQAAMHRRTRQDPVLVRRQVLARYYALSTMAVVFTLTCPQTFLWNNDGLQRPFFVARLVLVFVATLAFLTFRLQGSNPGYLTPEVMQQLDDWEKQQQEQAQTTHSNGSIESSCREEDAKGVIDP